MDELTRLARTLTKATVRSDKARADLHAAIVTRVRNGDKPATVARLTGYTPQRIAQIMDAHADTQAFYGQALRKD